MTCRAGRDWSAPSAIVLEGSTPAMLADGGKTDVVVLLRDRDAINGASGSTLFFRQTKRTFAEFALANATVRPDGPVNELLYGKSLTPAAILEGKRWPPIVAQGFVDQVARHFR